ncbi:unnamed protein product [Tenebrio molitor]|nr:unnamed protein product [Tenebrio molitor]
MWNQDSDVMEDTRSKHLRKGPTAFFVLRSRLEKN